jgi:hypothetical protein
VLEAVQKRLDENPHYAHGQETSERADGLLTKTLPKVATEMALCVFTYKLTRVLNMVGVPALLEAIKG